MAASYYQPLPNYHNQHQIPAIGNQAGVRSTIFVYATCNCT